MILRRSPGGRIYSLMSPNEAGLEYLVQISQELSLARTIEDISAVARVAARNLCGADGASFILKENDLCYYLDEDAISPLWKGRKFPMQACISGWSMIHREPVVIEDIYADERVPQAAYAPTFVRSLLVVPIRTAQPIGAIGNYWAKPYRATAECVRRLQSLADLIAIAIENVQVGQELARANHFLEDSVRARDEFLSIVAHELRTPLSSLAIQLDLLRRMPPTPERHKQATDLSLRQVGNLARLVENLLDVSRIRLNRVTLQAAEIDFSKCVREAVENFLPQAALSKNEIVMDLDPSLKGRWDETRLMQIVTNLVSNACKYAAGSQVRVITRRDAGLAVLAIEDDGPGIKAENQSRIFERFERDAPANHVSGLGLGLFITKKLAEAHGGRILLESAEGKGSRFTVELPPL